MPESENEMNAMADGGTGDAQSELQSLRTLISAALALLVVFCICIDLYLSSRVRDEKAAADSVALVSRNFNMGAGEFWSRLVEYSKTHPDFVQVIDKWKAHITVTPNANPVPPPKAK